MRALFTYLVACCIFLSMGVAAQTKADIIIINGKVATLDENQAEVEAVAIKSEKILFTGANTQALKFKSSKTVIINAAGKRIIPGLFDSHLHIIRAGRFYNAELRWDGVPSLNKALSMLRQQAERTPDGQWVRVVGGWNEYQFTEKRLPTLEEINNATGEVPAFILYLYGKAWLNKAGLLKLGINADTPNPPGGLIEKDSEGNPTGLLIAEPNAFLLYSTLAQLPELNTEEKINSTHQYMRELNRLGVTAVMDAGGGFQNYPDDYLITDSLKKLGQITIRLPHYLFAQKRGLELADYTKWIGMVDIELQKHPEQNAADYFVAGGGENLVADAADFENFLFPRPELPASLEKNLKQVIQLLVRNRWPFRLHATYNESISRFLGVMEEVNRETPFNGLPWFFDHAETVTVENLQRIKSLGGGIAIQHRMAYQGESFVHRYGKKAAQATPPVKLMLEMGIPVGMGTDGTRVASYNPWLALYWVVTGKTMGGAQVMAKENTIDRLTALRLYTSGGYSLIKENGKGRIQKGYYADMVILNKDFLTVQDEDIKSIVSKLTIVDGKIVYGDGEYAPYAPPALPVIPQWSPVKFFGGYQY